MLETQPKTKLALQILLGLLILGIVLYIVGKLSHTDTIKDAGKTVLVIVAVCFVIISAIYNFIWRINADKQLIDGISKEFQ